MPLTAAISLARSLLLTAIVRLISMFKGLSGYSGGKLIVTRMGVGSPDAAHGPCKLHSSLRFGTEICGESKHHDESTEGRDLL